MAIDHAAVATMVRGTRRDPRVLCLGLEILGRHSPDADGGQWAAGVHHLCPRRGEPRWAVRALQVLALDDSEISALTVFVGPLGPSLFPVFGLPFVLA